MIISLILVLSTVFALTSFAQGENVTADNEIKNQNMYRMLAWKNNPTPSIDLHYYEDETGIYGDKNHSVASVADSVSSILSLFK